MITCPQCGQSAEEGAQFCDSCGAQLVGTEGESVLAALPVGHQLARGYKIVELLSQSSTENWYRAVRTDGAEGETRFRLREREAPRCEPVVLAEVVEDEEASREDLDPTGPKAKTQELAPLKLEDAKSDSESTPEQETGEKDAEQAANTASAAETDALAKEGVAAQGEAIETPSDGKAGDSAAAGEASQQALTDQPQPQPSLQAAHTDEQSAEQPAAPDRGSVTDDVGELFARIRDISRTLEHPAFYKALDAFGENGRVYLAFPDEELVKLSERPQGIKMSESQALSIAIQVCQAVAFLHKRGFRMNDICPASVALTPDGRVKLTGLEWITNDVEIASTPLLNDGYTAPEIYRGQRVDKRADIFSVGCLLYTCLTGERLECETWLEEAPPIKLYPPHVITPALERVMRRALAFKPEDRYQTIEEFKTELLKIFTTVRLRAAAMTDVGMVRELNEDSILALEYLRDSLIEPDQAYLYVVSDGMGGAAAGEVASAIAVQTVRSVVERELEKAQAERPSLSSIAVNALEEAHRKILDYQQAHPEARGMGATGVVAIIKPPKAAVAWVGDSRAYMWSSNGLRQVTKDHSLAQRLIDIGQLTPEQARHYEHKNVILRSLGARPSGQSGPAGAEAVELTLKRGDRLLLCSDGLVAHVEDAQIDAILRRHSDPFEATRELIVAANAGGGTDNISVILVFAE